MMQQIGILNAVPSKRLFLSIIADYDLNKSICELIDNSFDMWTRNRRSRPINIAVTLDRHDNLITVEDDAGGIEKDDLTFIVGPGQSGSNATDQTIGIFGVGTKRAVVALAKEVRIKSRATGGQAHLIMFDDKWIDHEDWALPLFEVTDLQEGVTRVELSRLRIGIGTEEEELLRNHLGATYAKLLTLPEVRLTLNGQAIEPRFFDQWSFPPGYEPKRYHGHMRAPNGRDIALEVLAGLSNESSPTTGNYGVYFYCNDRLVAPAMKSLEVGFARGLAGLPHPKLSLTKVIVSINGDAGEMPWNSSKSDISTNHHTFQALQKWLVTVVSDYARMSRTYQNDWPEKVLRFKTGIIADVPIEDAIEANRSFLPAPPPSRPRLPERVAKVNRALAKKKPWVVPLYEGVVAANVVGKQSLANANWLALNLLEVTLIAALKAWLLNEIGSEISDKDLRSLLNAPKPSRALKDSIPLTDDQWDELSLVRLNIDRLTYGATTPVVPDADLASANSLVKAVLATLFEVVSDA